MTWPWTRRRQRRHEARERELRRAMLERQAALLGVHRADGEDDDGLRDRMLAVVAAVLDLGPWQLQALGTTKAGAPRHPLYLPADAPLAPWP